MRYTPSQKQVKLFFNTRHISALLHFRKNKNSHLMIIGYFDFVVIGIVGLINIIFWRKEIQNKIGCLPNGLIFGLILPLISQKLEIDRVTSEREILDNFTLLYTYLKFPIYWIVGAIQIKILSKKEEHDHA